jgi:hypothetical protein
MGTDRRQRVRPTHEWELLVPLFEWPEQERYEQIRPLMLFDVAVAERADEVGVSTSTLYRRLDRFAEDGMESLFEARAAVVELRLERQGHLRLPRGPPLDRLPGAGEVERERVRGPLGRSVR